MARQRLHCGARDRPPAYGGHWAGKWGVWGVWACGASVVVVGCGRGESVYTVVQSSL
jgi:hypothetical protein